MPTRSYALERGGPKRLTVRWRRGWKDFRVALDGTAWSVEPVSLESGVSLALPDGSSLFVQRAKRRWWSVALRDDLYVDRDGTPVAGSDGDPRVIGRRAASVLVLFAVLRFMLLGLWVFFQRSAEPGPPAALLVLGAEGLALTACGVLAMFGLRLPVAIAAGVLGAEVSWALVATVAYGGRPGGVLIQALVIAHLVRSWRRMKPRPKHAALATVFE